MDQTQIPKPASVPGNNNIMPQPPAAPAAPAAPQTPTPQSAWDDIHSYKGFERGDYKDKNLAIRHALENRARNRWQAEQTQKYHQTYGTETQLPDGSYQYKTPHPYSGKTMTATYRSSVNGQPVRPGDDPYFNQNLDKPGINQTAITKKTAPAPAPAAQQPAAPAAQPAAPQAQTRNTEPTNLLEGIAAAPDQIRKIFGGARQQSEPDMIPTFDEPPVDYDTIIRRNQRINEARRRRPQPQEQAPAPSQEQAPAPSQEQTPAPSQEQAPAPSQEQIQNEYDPPVSSPSDQGPAGPAVPPQQQVGAAPQQNNDRDGNGVPDTIQNPDTLPPEGEEGFQTWGEFGKGMADALIRSPLVGEAGPANMAWRAKQQAAIGKAFSPGRFGTLTPAANQAARQTAKGVRTGVSTLAKPVTVPGRAVADVARNAAQHVPGVRRVVDSAEAARAARHAAQLAEGRKVFQHADEMAKATGAIGKGSKVLKAIGSKAGPIGLALEGGAIAYDLKNRMDQGQSFEDAYRDVANEHTQSVRDAVNPLKWDMDGDGQITAGDFADKAFSGLDVISPVAHAQAAGQLGVELGGAANDINQYVFDQVTDKKGRTIRKNIEQSQEMSRNKAEQLGRQAAQLQSQNMEDPAIRAQYQELLARQQDALRRAEAMTNESADWNIGNQAYFGTSYPFRDAIEESQGDLKKQISSMQGKTLSPSQQLDMENMQLRQRERDRLLDMYDKEVGYFGDGAMPDYIRNNLKGAKNRIIDIGARLREPAVQNDPELRAQLEADLRHHTQRLTDMQSWARAAR